MSVETQGNPPSAPSAQDSATRNDVANAAADSQSYPPAGGDGRQRGTTASQPVGLPVNGAAASSPPDPRRQHADAPRPSAAVDRERARARSRSVPWLMAAAVIAIAALTLGLLSTIILVQPPDGAGPLAWPGFGHAAIDSAVRSHAVLAVALLPVIAFAGFRRDAYFPDIVAFFALCCAGVVVAVLLTGGVSLAQPSIVLFYLGLMALHALLLPYGVAAGTLLPRQRAAVPAVVPVRQPRSVQARPAAALRSRVPARPGSGHVPYDTELIRELAVYLQQWPMWRRMQRQADAETATFTPPQPAPEAEEAASEPAGESDEARPDEAGSEGSTYSQLVGVGNLLQRPTKRRRIQT